MIVANLRVIEISYLCSSDHRSSYDEGTCIMNLFNVFPSRLGRQEVVGVRNGKRGAMAR